MLSKRKIQLKAFRAKRKRMSNGSDESDLEELPYKRSVD